MESEESKPKLRLAKPRNTVPTGPAVNAESMGDSALPAAPNSPLPAYARTLGGKLLYEGKGKELLGIYARNVVLSILTLGLYWFYAKVDLQHYHLQHTRVCGGRFYYHATGGRKLRAFLIAIALLSLVLFAGWKLLGFLLEQRTDENIDAFRGTFLFMAFSVLLWVLRPIMLVGKQRFLLAYTSWNNIRFRFKGSIAQLYGIYLLDGLLILLTLGIYLPYHRVRVKGYLTRNSYLGDNQFDYNGRGGELLHIEVMGWFMKMITFGLYTPWLWAKRKRYHVNSTRFQNQALLCGLTGSDVISGILGGSLIVLFTLGFGFPWAVARWKRIMFGSIRVPSIQVERIHGEVNENAGVADALGEAGEFLEQLGELFG